jgi:hypothetical protein
MEDIDDVPEHSHSEPGPDSLLVDPVDLESAPPSRPRRTGVAVVAGVVVLAVGGFFGAQALAGGGSSSSTGATNTTTAANGQFANGARRPGTAGTITAIAGSILTVQQTAFGGPAGASTPTTATSTATVRVTTSASTRYTISKSVALSAIVKGDRIIVNGTPSNGAITATSISDLGTASATGNGFGGARPGGSAGGAPNGSPNGSTNGGGGLATGTVESVTGSTIVITTQSGTTTVTASSSTTVTKSVSGTLSDLKVGDSVRVNGTTAADGSVTATTVNVGGGFGGGGPLGNPQAGG